MKGIKLEISPIGFVLWKAEISNLHDQLHTEITHFCAAQIS